MCNIFDEKRGFEKMMEMEGNWEWKKGILLLICIEKRRGRCPISVG